MNSKAQIILIFVLLAAGLATGKNVYSWTGWEVLFRAEREFPDNTYKPEVRIGIAALANKVDADTPTEPYPVDMNLWVSSDNSWELSEDIREAGDEEYMWVLNIDPNGSQGSPGTATISWDNEFGYGNFEMREGYDGTGDVVVADMKATTSHQVSGTSDTGFTIHKSSETCAGTYSLPDNEWRMISLPCESDVSSTVANVFGDDFLGNYNETWYVWERDESLNQYYWLADNEWLYQGEGYWIRTVEGPNLLDMTGTATPLSTDDCASPGCFEIGITSGIGLFNMKGHPLPYEVKWSDVRIKVAGDASSPFTPSDADTAGYLSKTVYMWSGYNYLSYDDVTPGVSDGLLEPYAGFWVKVLSTEDMSILIPAGPNVFSSLDLLHKSELKLSKTSSKGMDYLFDWFIPKAYAKSYKSESKEPPGHAKRDAHRAAHKKSIEKNEEWYVRVIVEAPQEGMRDRNNVFGQLADSEFGYDEHDLNELPPLKGKHLTIVFPHRDWGDRADDYTSDYHPLSKGNQGDSWTFEVRTDDPRREVTLTWVGPNEILNNSWLMDESTGEVVEVIPGAGYTFVMNATSRTFIWGFSGKQKKYNGKSKKYK